MNEETADNRLAYAAFISYSHADNRQEGRKWADWLHHELETYEVPAELVGRPNRAGNPIAAQIYPVFQDEKELSASANLTSALTAALDASSYLVYLSSPQSARSVYVSQELRRFKQTGKGNRIIALILAGEPEYGAESSAQQCFPEVLRYRVDESGNIDHSVSQEPIAADVRLPGTTEQGFTTPEAYRQSLQSDKTLSRKEVERRVQAYKDRLDLAKLKIIAGVLDVPLGDLTQRDQAYQLAKARRRTKLVKRIAVVIGMLAVMAMALGIYAWTERNAAQTMLSRSLFLSGLNKIEQREVGEGAAYMAAAARYGNERTALYLQSMLMRQNGMTPMPRLDSTPVFSPDGHWIAALNATSNEQRSLQIWDAYTQKRHAILTDAKANAFSKLAFDGQNALYFMTADNTIAKWQDGKPQETVFEAPDDLRIVSFAPAADGRWLVIQGWHVVGGKMQYIKSILFNMQDGQTVVDQAPERQREGGNTQRVLFAPQGNAIAFHETEDNDNRVRVYPVDVDGKLQQARDYVVPAGIIWVRFSPDARHVFVRATNGLYHIDLRRDDSQIAKVAVQPIAEDVYFPEDGEFFVAVWQSNYTVYDMNSNAPVASGDAGVSLSAMLRDEVANASPDLTQRVENQEGIFFLVTDLAPPLLRSQLNLGSDLLSFRAMPDGKGVAVLKKNSHNLQYAALAGTGKLTNFIHNPEQIDRFGVASEQDYIYAISVPEQGVSTLRFYRATTGKPLGKPLSVKGVISFSHDGRKVSSRVDDHKMAIWEIESGKRLQTFGLRKNEKYKLSADLSTILVLEAPNQWRVQHVGNGQVLHREQTELKGAYFTPDNKYMLAFFNGKAQLYDLKDFVSRLTLPTSGDTPKAQLSPDGNMLAMAEDNKYIRLWNLERKQAIGQKIRNDAAGGYLEFSRDGKVLFASDPLDMRNDKGIAMYDTKTGMPVVMPFAISRINDVVLLPNGKDILTLDARSNQAVLNVWAVPDALLGPVQELADQSEVYFSKRYDNDAAAVIDAPTVAQRPESWFFQDPYIRPLVPDSSVPLTAYIEKQLPIRNVEQLRLIYNYWRFHPLARAALAVYFSRNKDTAFVANSLIRMTRLQLSRVTDQSVRHKTLALLGQAQKNMQENMQEQP
ncbi:hypothetical protein CAP48_19120 [Advenella sp. S44]|uniref:toll/interleukin-1 receptor domain-containing protein n=1 Tax=Advenella sp. S44 TaxID=1982755 RepID=UPI000C2B3C1F|nr:toll/interleukin-1 receptor domain-containing protein [Advenella sp. S44]PJX20511.1 hypothetical protein CAP48_19120 [Advenella sp. S44]